jgi:hypothetical protein
MSLTVHRIGIELYTSLMTFKTSTRLLFSGLQYMIDSFPQLVCVCYSTVNIGKCKQQVTELLLHMITIKFWKFDEYGLTSDSLLNSRMYRHRSNIVCMKFLFPDSIIIHYKHNHIIKLVKFSRGGGAVAPVQCTALPC